jgi:hypothetical protein
MRGKVVLVVLFAWIGAMASSCVTPATEDELTSMCDNLVQLRGEISNPSVETIVSDVAVRFDAETKKLEESRMREQKVLNDELQAKLDAAENEEEKTKLREEYSALLKDVAAKHEPGITAMNAKKKEAVADAKRQAQENQAAWNEAVNECVAQAQKEGVGQKVARCRMQAENTDKYWNGCR